MPSISDLTLKLQAGTDSTYYATWNFEESAKKDSGGASTSTIKKGDWVTILAGATYYNGVSIPSWVMKDTWYVVQVTQGDRAVLGRNKSGTNNIQSAISTKYLTTGSTSGSSGSTTTEDVKYLDHYLVKWDYKTSDGVWFNTSEEGNKTTLKQATYGAPANAVEIKVSVKPVSKTKDVNDKEVSYWTADWASAKIQVAGNPPERPSAPTLVINKYQLTTKLENIEDPQTDQIQFEIYRRKTDNAETRNYSWFSSSSKIDVKNCRAAYTFPINSGWEYRGRCRAINNYADSGVTSEWSEFSSDVSSIPDTPKNVRLQALSKSEVQISWTAIGGVTGYTVEYTTKKIYFDSASSEVQSAQVNVDTVNYAIITNMTSGEEYFFRVKATNEGGDSGWSTIESIIIGEPPAPPTTWSSTTTAITGEPITLYWVHNAKDGSKQTYAKLALYDSQTETITEYTFGSNKIDNNVLSYMPLTEDEQEDGGINSCVLKTDSYNEGVGILWKIQTAGITQEFSDWSVQRTIDIHAPATLELRVSNSIDGEPIETLSTFPFYIMGFAGPATQIPIGYHVTITSDERYETVDNIGNAKVVNKGDNVYSKYFDVSDPLLLEMTSGVISLMNNISYTVSCIVSMNSGLTAEASVPLTVSWTVRSYEPDAEIGINMDDYSAYISPYCLDVMGRTVTDVSLSIYRKEFDGSFTEIASGIETDANEYIVDPHPSLDFARYRIVAVSKTTGAVSYYDPPGYPIGGKEVVIQWDEAWSNFDTSETGQLDNPPWSGSILKLPYNIDVSESNSSDVSLIEYVGRQHPVSYYGTQLGVSANWSVEIPKSDIETIYALRRLARWMGDVYVREPSGSGYWANISVSFSQKHREMTIPVTLNISQVEGGI